MYTTQYYVTTEVHVELQEEGNMNITGVTDLQEKRMQYQFMFVNNNYHTPNILMSPGLTGRRSP